MMKYKLNTKYLLFSVSVSILIVSCIHFLYFNNIKMISTYIEIGKTGTVPSLNTTLEIQKIEDFFKVNKLKGKVKYSKDNNILEIKIETKDDSFENESNLMKIIELDLILRATNEVNNSIQKQKELNLSYLKLTKDSTINFGAEALNKFLDINNHKLPIIYYRDISKYNKLSYLIGLFIIIFLLSYIILIKINEYKIKK